MTLDEKQLYIGRPSQILNIISFIIWSWTLFVPIIIYLRTNKYIVSIVY